VLRGFLRFGLFVFKLNLQTTMVNGKLPLDNIKSLLKQQYRNKNMNALKAFPTQKTASTATQTNLIAQGWTASEINGIQFAYPHKFLEGVFVATLVKEGDQIRNTETGETWALPA
jgi:hypothetical protein